jgi:hypothetical protein
MRGCELSGINWADLGGGFSGGVFREQNAIGGMAIEGRVQANEIDRLVRHVTAKDVLEVVAVVKKVLSLPPSRPSLFNVQQRAARQVISLLTFGTWGTDPSMPSVLVFNRLRES